MFLVGFVDLSYMWAEFIFLAHLEEKNSDECVCLLVDLRLNYFSICELPKYTGVINRQNKYLDVNHTSHVI
jgi:hypothetical protein